MGKTTPGDWNLRRFNAVMGALHFLQGALMLYLSSSREWTITATYLEFAADTQRLEPVMEAIGTIELAYLAVAFLFLSAIAHALIATILYDRYVAYLDQGMNPYRWYEYAVSASVMIVLIAMLAGVWDLGTLIALFGLVAVMNLCGLVMERHNRLTEETDWSSFVVGSIAGAVPWVVIAISIVGTFDAGGSPPDFVIVIYGSLFVLFNLFAINMLLQYREVWKWEDYLYGERAYIVLSLVAKSLLAWQVYFGALNSPV
ncbi:heliorhodopsin HeR [Halosimplex rubrum]|uniref:Heliorhodopsin HeR n=1 Tax=Halosimplex rubrum TaxID=869889 RepID=A0A7D5P5J6_9EURY|nr:heliorhodopsin HeR [Halosimplex rubrum]QLH79681.1 heliorhodopsin HeR [Halosimplex rubrum]